MSHSRILVLDNSNYNCDQIFEEMQSYGNGVDYVDDSTDTLDQDCEWFLNYASCMGFSSTSEDNHKFKISSVKNFWGNMTKDVQQILEDDGGVSELNRFELEDRLGMKRGFWILIDGELYTLPYFVRIYGKMKDKEFEITKTLDYHM